jgi:hypothetical protein
MSALPGVKVGPLDPDSTSQFGTVSQSNSARQLIRLHTQMNPPGLRRALSRPRDDERTLGIDIDEVREYLDGLKRENGDPLVPEGAVVVSAAVRGDHLAGQQILTFSYRLPSGRVAKWHAPYNADVLPDSYDNGSRLSQIKTMKDRGVVAFDTEGTQAEIQRRQLTEARREIAALRKAAEGRGGADDAVSAGDGEGEPDTRSGEERNDELEQLRRANQEMRDELVQLRAVQNLGAGEVPTGGLEADLATSPGQAGEGGEADPPGDNVASQDPPFEGYDELKADQVAAHLKHEDRTAEERQAILDYERTHANRKTVVGAGEESLGSGS